MGSRTQPANSAAPWPLPGGGTFPQPLQAWRERFEAGYPTAAGGCLEEIPQPGAKRPVPTGKIAIRHLFILSFARAKEFCEAEIRLYDRSVDTFPAGKVGWEGGIMLWAAAPAHFDASKEPNPARKLGSEVFPGFPECSKWFYG